MDESSEKKPDTNQINLKVVTQDGNEIFFKVGAPPTPPLACSLTRRRGCRSAR